MLKFLCQQTFLRLLRSDKVDEEICYELNICQIREGKTRSINKQETKKATQKEQLYISMNKNQ